MADLFLILLIFGLRLGPERLFNSVMKNYGEHRPDLPLNGQQLARQLLDRAGLKDVPIVTDNSEEYTDSYDSDKRVLSLSARVAGAHSVAAYATAAHEVAARHSVRAQGDLAPVGQWTRQAFFIRSMDFGGGALHLYFCKLAKILIREHGVLAQLRHTRHPCLCGQRLCYPFAGTAVGNGCELRKRPPSARTRSIFARQGS
jgi:hypothetical protein